MRKTSPKSSGGPKGSVVKTTMKAPFGRSMKMRSTKRGGRGR